MKNLLLLTILVFSITSCVTRNRCERKFPPLVKESNSNSITKTESDSAIPVHGASGNIQNGNPCDTNGRIIPFYIEVEKPGKPKQNMWSDGKTINSNCDCPDTTLIIKRAKESVVQKSETVKVVQGPTVYKTPWYDVAIDLFLLAIIGIFAWDKMFRR